MKNSFIVYVISYPEYDMTFVSSLYEEAKFAYGAGAEVYEITISVTILAVERW